MTMSARRSAVGPIPPSTSLAGTCLPGGVRLERAVASGASGTIYRAWHDELGALAVKISHAEDDHTALRSMREARAAAALDAPGVVRVMSAGRLPDGRSWVAMEWIEGVTLEDALVAGGARWSLARTLDVAAQLARALAVAHAAGIVHRDLKPAHVMLRRDGGHAVIVDFGIARSAGDAATSASRCAGTPHYMAPEQALGEDLDARADLYALGCVLVRMLTGRVPFDGSAVEVLLAHAGAPVPVIAGVPRGVRLIVERLMAKRPEDRPARAQDVVAALEALRGEVADPFEATVPVTLLRSTSGSSRSTSTLPLTSPIKRWREMAVAVVVVLVGLGSFAMARSMHVQGAAAAPWLQQKPTLPVVEPARPSNDPVMIVVDSGHSMRATIVGSPIEGGVLNVKLEIWDAEDQPIAAREVAATVRAPGGKALALGLSGTNGVFNLRQRTDDAGEHVVTIFAPSGETTFSIRVEVGPRPAV